MNRNDFKDKYMNFINYKIKLPLNMNKHKRQIVYTKFLRENMYLHYFSNDTYT